MEVDVIARQKGRQVRTFRVDEIERCNSLRRCPLAFNANPELFPSQRRGRDRYWRLGRRGHRPSGLNSLSALDHICEDRGVMSQRCNRVGRFAGPDRPNHASAGIDRLHKKDDLFLDAAFGGHCGDPAGHPHSLDQCVGGLVAAERLPIEFLEQPENDGGRRPHWASPKHKRVVAELLDRWRLRTSISTGQRRPHQAVALGRRECRTGRSPSGRVVWVGGDVRAAPRAIGIAPCVVPTNQLRTVVDAK